MLSAIVLTNCFFGALFRPLSSPTSSSSSKSSSTGSVNAEIVNVEQPTAQSSVLTTAEDNLEGHQYSKKDYDLPDSANGSFSSPPVRHSGLLLTVILFAIILCNFKQNILDEVGWWSKPIKITIYLAIDRNSNVFTIDPHTSDDVNSIRIGHFGP